MPAETGEVPVSGADGFDYQIATLTLAGKQYQVVVPQGAIGNVSVAAGASPSALVVNATGIARLYSVTVAALTGATTAVTLTDGQGGALLAVIPADFPGGDIYLAAPKSFATSIYANTSGASPAFTVGYGP